MYAQTARGEECVICALVWMPNLLCDCMHEDNAVVAMCLVPLLFCVYVRLSVNEKRVQCDLFTLSVISFIFCCSDDCPSEPYVIETSDATPGANRRSL